MMRSETFCCKEYLPQRIDSKMLSENSVFMFITQLCLWSAFGSRVQCDKIRTYSKGHLVMLRIEGR
jgi:hypothetical protein